MTRVLIFNVLTKECIRFCSYSQNDLIKSYDIHYRCPKTKQTNNNASDTDFIIHVNDRLVGWLAGQHSAAINPLHF